MAMERLAKEKLVEKHIDWKEVYTDKTKFLKDQFEEVIGEGSYFRFEGTSRDTGDDYYAIVGPAKVHAPRAKFFAGVRKLPATYSAGGKYFDSMDRAINYAHDTWGVPIPKSMRPYTSASLYGISNKVKEWKKKREKDGESGKDKKKEKKKIEEKSNEYPLKITTWEEMRRMNHFNLAERLQKTAMGYQWMENRNQYRWWDYAELLNSINSGHPDPDWQAAFEADPSMQTLLNEAATRTGKKIRELKREYKLTDDIIANQFKQYIGYHPAYGGYLLFIGPHVGEGKREDYKYRYGYFILKVTPANLDALKQRMAKYTEQYGIEFDVSDLMVMVKSPSGEFDPTKGKQPKDTESVNLGNPAEFNAFFSPRIDPSTGQPVVNPTSNEVERVGPMVGQNSHFTFNRRGLSKWRNYLRQNWGPAFDGAIQELAQRQHIDVDDVMESMVSSNNFMTRVMNLVKAKYNNMVESGDAAIMGMPEPPPSNTVLTGFVGAQNFTEMPRNKLTIRSMLLQKEVAEAMAAGMTTPEEIAASMNEFPKRLQALENQDAEQIAPSKRSKKPVAMSEIRKQMEIINRDKLIRDNSGNVVGERPFSDMVREYDDRINDLIGVGGFDDLKSAFDIAKLYLTSLPVDPVTGAKMGMEEAAHPFDMPEHFENTTSEDLKRWEAEGEEYERLRAGEATEEEMALDIGDEQSEEVSSDVVPQVRTPAEEEEDKEDKEEEDAPQEEVGISHLVDLLSNTIQGLIKIAAELDADGKYEDAEEVHKVIRKYQSRIL